MAIFRGIGGAGDSTTDATLTAVTEQATAAASSASAAASSASAASGSAANASTYASNSLTYSQNSQTSSVASSSAKDAAQAAQVAASTSETNAAASETAAAASETAAAASATSAATSLAGIGDAETNAAASASAASTSATNAANSATAAASSASAASTSETNAAASASAASTSETNAATSESNAATSASSASTSASNASTSETNAASSASAAATSASNASTSETNAASSAAAASTSETNAAASASAASTSETNAAASESAAATSASNAATSASNASTSETNASNSATAAASSATSAASSASSASTSASNASTSETNAAISETNAATSETNAATSATAAASSASSASTSASNASTSETNAASSASAASTSATNAATSATNSASSATSASTAATNAASSASSAAASYDDFDDRYLGAKSSGPSLDNDGDALVTGALYFDTTSNSMKVYNGTSWLDSYATLSGALIATNNLSDLNNTATARTNLGLGTAATTASTDYATAAQGTLADSATQPGDNISTLTNDSGYLTSFTETNDLTAAVTWANVPDANITQSSVTQHQAALSITESQISDLGTYLTDITGENLGDLSNVTLTSPSNGQILKYNGTAWVNGTDAGGIALTDLSVGAEGTASGDGAIAYNNTSGVFTYTPPTAAGIGAATSAQGTLADSATQPGDNISTLTNDSGYVTPSSTATFTNKSGDISQWTNDSGYLTSETSHADVVVDGDFASQGLMKRGATAGSYSIVTDNSTNWNTAYGWGDHASAGYLTTETYTGTVTSVGATVPTGLSVSGSPITSSGTLAITFAAGYSIPTTTKQGQWDTAYSWGNHASAGYLTDITGESIKDLSDVYSAMSPTDGQLLTWDNANTRWAAQDAPVSLPSQTGNAGYLLTTDGTTASWTNTVNGGTY
jgi:hypothetical protein